MAAEQNKRPRRNPLSQEEVANIIAHKRRRELQKTLKFKSGSSYKVQNIFNIGCICIYFELLFCFFGPSDFQQHLTQKITPRYGVKVNDQGNLIVSDMDIHCVEGDKYVVIIEDFIPVPDRFTVFTVGKDFILGKELKGMLGSSDKAYRIFSASPILFLSVFVLVICFGAYIYDLNENAYSLMALTVLNGLTLTGILFL